MKKRIISFIFIFCFLSFFVSSNIVFASGQVSDFLVFNGSSTVSDTVKNNLSLNSTFNDGCVFCKYDTGFSTYFFMCDLDFMYTETGSNGWKYYSNYNSSGSRIANCHEYDGDASSRNYDFSNIINNVNAQYVLGFNGSSFIICYVNSSLTSGLSLEYICQNSTSTDSWQTRLPAKRPDLKYCVINPVLVFYNPSDLNSFTGLNLDFNETDFYNWLVDNDKVEISVSSGGPSVAGKIPAYIGLQKLKSFISFYKQYGGSNTSFFKFIKGWFSYMNIASQTGDNINVLKNTIDNLYKEYLNSYIINSYSNTLNHAHQRNNIQTNTDDNNTTLITDDSNDSIDISILRDILRGIISLSTSITSHFEALFDKLNDLNFTVNVSNNGGTAFDSNIIWGTGDITQSENYLALTSAFMDKGVDVSAAENLKINYLDNASQQDSFTVSVVMPDQYVNGSFTEKTVTHTIDNTSKMYNTLLLFRKLIAFAVIAYFAIRIRFELPHLIRGE